MNWVRLSIETLWLIGLLLKISRMEKKITRSTDKIKAIEIRDRTFIQALSADRRMVERVNRSFILFAGETLRSSASSFTELRNRCTISHCLYCNKKLELRTQSEKFCYPVHPLCLSILEADIEVEIKHPFDILKPN